MPVNAPRIATLAQTVAEVWAAIKVGKLHPSATRSAAHCATCPFRGHCPIFWGK